MVIEVEGLTVPVTAAIAKGLPVSVLLGTDVPQLGQLLHANPLAVHTGGMEHTLVTTRTQARQQVEETEERARREKQSGVHTTDLGGLDGRLEVLMDGHAGVLVDGCLEVPVDGHAEVLVDGCLEVPVDGRVGVLVDGCLEVPVDRYVLVVCDYGTRYLEAVPMKTINAESVAEELIKLFARGIPKKILTDQGPNFTSQLLAEVYRLLHVDALQTSPYHPQTDGTSMQPSKRC